MGRGTMAQAYFVATVEAGYLMHHMRVYPYVRKQHNQVDALGHAALILTYTITLILRNHDDSFLSESFPREGYGWFIVCIYVFILPLPTFVNFWRNTQEPLPEKLSDDTQLTSSMEAVFSNPLSPDDEEDPGAQTEPVEMSSVDLLGGTTAAAGSKGAVLSGAMIPKLAKMQREHHELQSEIKAANAELNALRKENLAFKSASSILQNQQPNAAPDTTVTAGGESEDGAGVPATAAAPLPTRPAREPTQSERQALVMKQLAADETLSDESRDAARQQLQELISTQVLESQVRWKQTNACSGARLCLKRILSCHYLST